MIGDNLKTIRHIICNILNATSSNPSRRIQSKIPRNQLNLRNTMFDKKKNIYF